jgi:hypothetical protein
MANVNAPFGFQYAGRQEGGSPTEGLTSRIVSSAYGVAIFQGDPVISMTSGYIQVATSNSVTVAGVFNGTEYLNSNVGRKVWFNSLPSSGIGADAKAYISNDPPALWVAQSNGTAIAFADIGANIGFATGTGNTTTGRSTYALDQTTIGTTNTLPFRIVGLWSQYAPPGSAGTDDTTPYNWAVVALNNTDRSTTTGV